MLYSILFSSIFPIYNILLFGISKSENIKTNSQSNALWNLTPYWWSLNSAALRLFTKPFIQVQTKSASLAFVIGIHWWPVISPHAGPVTRKTFPFDDLHNRTMVATALNVDTSASWILMSINPSTAIPLTQVIRHIDPVNYLVENKNDIGIASYVISLRSVWNSYKSNI